MTFDAATFDMLKDGIWETLFMTFTSSFFALFNRYSAGIILIVTDKRGIRPVPWLQKILGLAINLLRSVPFIILLIMVIPITKKMSEQRWSQSSDPAAGNAPRPMWRESWSRP